MDDAVAQRLRENETQIAKVWTFIRELATAFWGDNVTRDNGLRSDVRKLQQVTAEIEEGQDELRREIQHYMDVKRKETCEGLKELARMEANKATEAEGEVEVKVAQINSKPQTIAAVASTLGPIVMLVIFILDKLIPAAAK